MAEVLEATVQHVRTTKREMKRLIKTIHGSFSRISETIGSTGKSISEGLSEFDMRKRKDAE